MNNTTKIDTHSTIYYNLKFFNYNNKTWTKIAPNSFRFYQVYNRGEGNPLSTFLAQATNNFNRYIYDIFYIYGIKYDNDLVNSLRESFYNLCQRFYNEFMINKYIIDTTLDADGDYVYDGGSTTLTYNIDIAIGIAITNIKNKKNNYIKKQKNISIATNPTLIFKLENINVNNVRW